MSDVSFKLEGIHDEYFKVSCIFLPENNLLSKRNRETSESLMTYLNSPVRNSHNIRGFTYTMFYGIGGGRVGLPNFLQIVPQPPKLAAELGSSGQDTLWAETFGLVFRLRRSPPFGFLLNLFNFPN